MPLVSIITNTYNRGHLIGETIQSVLDQTFTDFEYLIVDEASEDDTEQVVQSFGDSRIQYIRIPNTRGHMSYLRNYGMRRSTGKYIAFIDSDDLWLPTKLNAQVTALEKDNQIGFSFTDIEMFNRNDIIRKSLYKKSGSYSGSVFNDLIQNKFVICETTLFFRRDCLEKIGYQDENFLSGDSDFTIALATYFNAYAIYEPIVRVRRHDQNTSSKSYLNRMNTYFEVLQKVLDRNSISKELYTKIRTKAYYAFGMQMLNSQEYGWANYFFLKNILSNPFQWKSWVRLSLTLPKQIFRRKN